MTDVPLLPWTQCVDVDDDVLNDTAGEGIFALDLGVLADYVLGVAAGIPQEDLPLVPQIYCDPERFFRVSYMTSGLHSLLNDVLGRLTGANKHSVLKMITSFGGGKSHTLAALLHCAKHRPVLDGNEKFSKLPKPDGVQVAVIDGQYFDVVSGKPIPGQDFAAQTIWGWIGWMLGGIDGYNIVRKQDEARIAPGADVIRELLGESPNLVLIDELLEYLISAGGVKVNETTLRDETLSFLKHLTVAVDNTSNSALVFSLQSSSRRESLEYASLQSMVDHLAARKDQQREPVDEHEILNVIQHRLISNISNPDMKNSVAEAFRGAIAQQLQGYMSQDEANQYALSIRDLIKVSYPFHPGLIAIMRERWASIPEFQRTRGALRFLAACLRSAINGGDSRPLLTPGDIPISDSTVRIAFLKAVGATDTFQACLEHDFTSEESRTRIIDARRAEEQSSELHKRPATRVATTILLASFGGLRRPSDESEDVLPPGLGENEILRHCISPDLDNTTIQACLKELREYCLYLHYDNGRYSYKTDPNVTLLVEHEAEQISVSRDLVTSKLKDLLSARLSSQRSAILWPTASTDIPDNIDRLLVAYLPPAETTGQGAGYSTDNLLPLLEEYGKQPRKFRNGVLFSEMAPAKLNALQEAIINLLAVERIRNRESGYGLSQSQIRDLSERHEVESSKVEAALLTLYTTIHIPTLERHGNESIVTMKSISTGELTSRFSHNPGSKARVHERLLDVLMASNLQIYNEIAPTKIVQLFMDGASHGSNDESGVLEIERLISGLYEFLGFPRLVSSDSVKDAIALGVKSGEFGYVRGHPRYGSGGAIELQESEIVFQQDIRASEVLLDSGFLVHPRLIQAPTTTPDPGSGVTAGGPETPPPAETPGGNAEPGTNPPFTGPETTQSPPIGYQEIHFVVVIEDQELVFDAWEPFANLSELANTLTLRVSAQSKNGVSNSEVSQKVLDPLRKLGILVKSTH